MVYGNGLSVPETKAAAAGRTDPHPSGLRQLWTRTAELEKEPRWIESFLKKTADRRLDPPMTKQDDQTKGVLLNHECPRTTKIASDRPSGENHSLENCLVRRPRFRQNHVRGLAGPGAVQRSVRRRSRVRAGHRAGLAIPQTQTVRCRRRRV